MPEDSKEMAQRGEEGERSLTPLKICRAITDDFDAIRVRGDPAWGSTLTGCGDRPTIVGARGGLAPPLC